MPIVIDIKANSAELRSDVQALSRNTTRASKNTEKLRDELAAATSSANGLSAAMLSVRNNALGAAAAIKSLRASAGVVSAMRAPSNAVAMARGARQLPSFDPNKTQKMAPPTASRIVAQMGAQAAIAQYGGAAAAGNPFAARVVNSAAAQQRSVQRAQAFLNPQPQSNAQILQQAIMRSRFTQVGGKMIGHPLGVDMGKLLASGQGGALSALMGGGGAAGGAAAAGAGVLGPLAVGLGVAAAAALAFAGAAKGAYDAILPFRDIQTGTQGSAAQARVLQGLGIDPRAVVDRALGSDLGRAELVRFGGSAVGRELGGNLNSIAPVMEAIEAIRGMGEREARITAERLGTPELLNTRQLTEEQVQRLNQAGLDGSFDQAAVAATRLQFEVSMMTVEFLKLAPLLTPMIEFATNFAKSISGFLNAPGAGRNSMFGGGAWSNGQAPLNSPEAETARNTKRMADAMEVFVNGTAGGGSRARWAIPDRWQGPNKLSGYSNINDVSMGLF